MICARKGPQTDHGPVVNIRNEATAEPEQKDL
jgi:hypothetical protein